MAGFLETNMGMTGVSGSQVPLPSSVGGGGQTPGVARASSISEGVAQIERRSSENLQAAARTIDTFVRDMGRSLDFRVDSSSGKQIVRVSNPQTGEVVRQIPNEEAVQIARSLNYLQSVLVSIKA
jgi:flagellar protein FlaG